MISSRSFVAPHCETMGFHRKEKPEMANIKSQKKRIKTNEKARLRNRAAKA